MECNMEASYIQDKVIELERLQRKIIGGFYDDNDIIKANEIAEELIEITKTTYNKIGEKYSEVRTLELTEFDKILWNILMPYIDKYLGKDYNNLKMLDVGTGHGRDLKHALDLGFDVTGIDNADIFINMLQQLSRDNVISKDSFKQGDMRNLPFQDNTFDIVRQQATLLHLPIITKGFTADKAVEESYRVLKNNGLLYVFIKKGNGLKYIDTNEGLGGRIFQFYNEDDIANMLIRAGFKILDLTTEKENRNVNIIDWIVVIAKK